MFLLVACGTLQAGGDDPPGIEMSRSSVAFEWSAPLADLAALVEADTRLAIDLLRQSWTSENLIMSPFSIATALGMLGPGARGETRSEMATVLHETLPDDRLHRARATLLVALAPEQPEGSGDDPPPFTLRAANQVWAQRGYAILESYLDELSRSYDAGVALLDFMANPEDSRVSINDAIAEQTEQRIEDLIPEGVITDLTRLILTNAIYANRLNEFDPERTSDGPFHTQLTEVVVPMMTTTASMRYYQGDGYTAAWLSYVGDADMMVLLPDGDIESLLGTLTVEELAAANEGGSVFRVDLTMPRFEFRSSITLAEALKALGMVAAFVPPSGESGADLTGIVEARELYVQNVVHQGFVAVDEKGTEAAAATAVIAGATSMPQLAALKLDRPFIFLIQHRSTAELLFAGMVANPSG
ncbi:MAG: serpin family protein [Acidimicrobiia bacterium]